jgi:hypothetical protein
MPFLPQTSRLGYDIAERNECYGYGVKGDQLSDENATRVRLQ